MNGKLKAAQSTIPANKFRVGVLFAVCGAALGFTYDSFSGREVVVVGGVIGTMAGLVVWRAVVALTIFGAGVRALVRWLARDPYER